MAKPKRSVDAAISRAAEEAAASVLAGIHGVAGMIRPFRGFAEPNGNPGTEAAAAAVLTAIAALSESLIAFGKANERERRSERSRRK